jgi:hypothetical protein
LGIATEAQKPARRPLPRHLPREDVIHSAPCTCPTCGGALRRIGEDVSETLDYVPGRFKVIRHVRAKLLAAPAIPSSRRRRKSELLPIRAHDHRGGSEANADAAALIDIGALGRYALHDIFGGHSWPHPTPRRAPAPDPADAA